MLWKNPCDKICQNERIFWKGRFFAFGVVLLVIGLMNLVKYFRTDALEAAKSQTMLKGLIALFAGTFCILKSYWFVVTFPVLTVLYGVAVLVVGLGKVQWTIDLVRLKKGKWFWAAVSAVISLGCAAVILANPFEATTVLWMFTGIAMIVDAVFDFAALLMSGKEKRTAG